METSTKIKKVFFLIIFYCYRLLLMPSWFSYEWCVIHKPKDCPIHWKSWVEKGPWKAQIFPTVYSQINSMQRLPFQFCDKLEHTLIVNMVLLEFCAFQGNVFFKSVDESRKTIILRALRIFFFFVRFLRIPKISFKILGRLSLGHLCKISIIFI